MRHASPSLRQKASAAYDLALQGGRLLHKPYIPMLLEDNVRAGFFEADAFEAMREHLPVPLRAVMTFAYYTGWRIGSEVLGLEWRQVDRSARIVRLDVGCTKNNRGRTFPYGRHSELVALMEQQGTEHRRLVAVGTLCVRVFHRKGRPIKSFRAAFESACKAARCPGRLIHDSRRTAVRNLVQAAVLERTATTISGYKTRSLFDRYDKVSEADI